MNLDFSLRARNTYVMNETTMWREWLAAHLKERDWRQADLVRESQGTIKRDRASKWLSGNEVPSYRLAVAVANTLDVAREEALAAAGYLSEQVLRSTTNEQTQDSQVTLSVFTDIELTRELLSRAQARAERDAKNGLD